MSNPRNPARDLLDKVTGREISCSDGESLLEQIKSRLTEGEYLRARSVIASIRLQEEGEQRKQEIKELFTTGWFYEYLLLAQYGEAPDSFHLFSAMTVLSHLIGRNAWSDMGLGAVYAPINTFLVSPPGVARRSMVIRLAAEIAHDAGACVAADTMTPEGLIQRLVDDPQQLIVVEETANLISKREYQQGLIQNLCTLLDCPPYFERTLRHEKVAVEEPTVSMLTGCAPNWFRDSMPTAAGAGGLTSRMFMIYEPTSQRTIPFPKDVLPDAGSISEIKRLLSFQARTIAEGFEGCLEFPPGDVKRTYAAFYEDTKQKTIHADERVAPYYSRKAAHLHRVCLAMLAAEQKGPVLDVDTLDRAIKLLDLVEGGVAQIYAQTGMDRPGRMQSRILRYLEKKGRATYSQILRAVSDSMSAKELRETLTTLCEAQRVRTVPKAGSNRVDVFYEPL